MEIDKAQLLYATIAGVSGTFAAIFSAFFFSFLTVMAQHHTESRLRSSRPSDFDELEGRALALKIVATPKYSLTDLTPVISSMASAWLLITGYLVLGVTMPLILLFGDYHSPTWQRIQLTVTLSLVIATIEYFAFLLKPGASVGKEKASPIYEPIRDDLKRARHLYASPSAEDLAELERMAEEVSKQVVARVEAEIDQNRRALHQAVNDLRLHDRIVRALVAVVLIGGLLLIWL